MHKRTIAIILSLVLLFTIVSCGRHKVDFTETSETTSSDTIILEDDNIGFSEETIVETEPTVETIFDYSDEEPVLIYMRYIDLSGRPIEEAVVEFQEENPDSEYGVYNDEYYSLLISYGDYVSVREQINSYELIDSSLQSIFTDESYNGAFVSAEYDDLLQNITFYVNREVFEENSFTCQFGSALISFVLSDTVQAYNFIMPEDRLFEITYVDNATGEVIEIE